MPLTLRLLKTPDNTQGAEPTRSFGPEGGTLGRSLTNDWVLPDPMRYVSSKHARIDFEDGVWWLTDTSTNGVFINGAKQPMASSSRHPLADGDRLRIGDYVVGVSISQEVQPYVETIDDIDFLLEETAESAAPRAPVAPTAPESHDEMLDPLALLGGSSPSGTGPVDAFGQRVGQAASARASHAGDTPRPNRISRSQAAELRQAYTGASTQPAEPRTRPASPPDASDELPAPTPEELKALRMLLKGAGLDPKLLVGESATRVLQIAGQLLRETVLGLTEILQARAELKNLYRVSQTTIQPGDNNPLKFSAGVEEALRKLFVDQGSRYLSPVEAIRDSFRDIKIHHLALLSSMQKALHEFLRRFDPDELQEKFDRGLKRGGLLGATNKMKYWDLYQEMYQVLAQHTPDQPVPHLFGEEFGRAYEAEVERLRAIQRNRSGS